MAGDGAGVEAATGADCTGSPATRATSASASIMPPATVFPDSELSGRAVAMIASRSCGAVTPGVRAMVLIGVLKFIFAAQKVSNIILLATSESRTLSLLALDQIGEGLREAASVTIIIVILMTLGLALMARFLGLRVGIQQ